MALKLRDHPDRAAAIAEAHARPPLPIHPPATIHHLAISTAGEGVGRALYQIMFGTEDGAAERHTVRDRDGLTAKLERHTEFASLTLLSTHDGPAERQIERIAAGLPEGAALLVALRARLLPERCPSPPGQDVGGVLRGGIEVTSSFRVGPDGFIDYQIVAEKLGPSQLGRRVQRVLEVETYRTMALVGLPLARRVGPQLTELEDELARVTETLRAGRGSDADILERLQSLSARTEAMRAETRFRFSASRAYATLVEERLASLAEEKVGERPTLTGFTRTRLAPAIRTIVSSETRQAELSDAVGRALQLLRARIDVQLNKANQEILSSMNERQHRQLLLTEAVESLSVIAISYYLLGILAYPVKSLRELGLLPFSEAVTLGLLAPVTALVVFATIRLLRSRWRDA